MFVGTGELLRTAQRNHKAIASINVYGIDTIKGALLAAKDNNCPIILAFGAKCLKNLSLRQMVFLAETCAEDFDVQCALHLDHCSDFGIISEAIKSGFSSVMYDGSMLPFEENLKNTRVITQLAHAAGVDVEAELGSIKTGTSSAENTGNYEQYTDPEAAATFCCQTNVDALAVSIGTVHGMYKGSPCIRQDVLTAIRRATDVPLVLHGGSGNDKNVLQELISNGICKVNINTELSLTCVSNTLELLKKNPRIHLSDLYIRQIEWFRNITGSYIHMLNIQTD